MMVQKPIKEIIEENYITGEYSKPSQDKRELYEKYVKNYNSILNYQWGVWCTSYAFRNLFELGKCVSSDGIWIYSDTDSCYATKWDVQKIDEYNTSCKKRLKDNGYGCVIFNGREYWLGCAELDGTYTQMKTMGAKRYCVRDSETGKLKITVAGVPKIGAECLEDDINNFTPNFVFSGSVTGKLTHEYIDVEDIYIDENGNEVGDSIDLYPADYCLSKNFVANLDDLFREEIEVQIYEEE